MATTSLARQLEQLRAATVDSHVQKSGVAQQGPNLLNVQLSGEQLTLLAKDAFSKLCDLCPAIAIFKSDIFKDDQVISEESSRSKSFIMRRLHISFSFS